MNISGISMKLKPMTLCALTTLICVTAMVTPPRIQGVEIPQKPLSPSLQPIEDLPGLPRVLLIGDSISMGYTVRVRKALQGKANVHRPPTNCGPTTKGLGQVDDWLGTNKWEVIHFNFGLHDLKQLKNGERNVSVEEYESNLRKLTARLKHTGAVVIWASTTPVPSRRRPSQSVRNPEDVFLYNEIAAHVMREQGVITDDLYTLVLPRISQLQPPDDVHFNSKGCDILADQVAATIATALSKTKP